MTSEQTLYPEQEPHHNRQIAESFGLDPKRYDRARPQYPNVLVNAIIAACPGKEILDVGIGTGISAKPFLAAGCSVLGIDVDARMAEFARQRGFDVEVAKFEEWDSAGLVFDAVISGQAWHWIEPVLGANKAAEVLRNNGRLAIFWNESHPPTELAKAFAEVYRRVVPDSLASQWANTNAGRYTMLYAKIIDGIKETSKFGEPEQWRYDWEQVYTRQEWLELLSTQGGSSLISSCQLSEVLEGIGTVIDTAGGNFIMKYVTVVITAIRKI